MDTPSQKTPALPRNPRLPQILEQNWQAEMTGYYTYRALAQREPDPGRKHALENMATAEKEHAGLWAGRLRELGEPAPVYRGKPAGDARIQEAIGGLFKYVENPSAYNAFKFADLLKALGGLLP